MKNEIATACEEVLDCFKRKGDGDDFIYCSPVLPPQITWVPADKYDELRSAALRLVEVITRERLGKR